MRVTEKPTMVKKVVNRRTQRLICTIILLAIALAIVSTGMSSLCQKTDCVTDDCRITVTRYGWPIEYRVQYSQDHDLLFKQMHPRWYRNTYVFGVSLIGLSIDLCLYFVAYIGLLSVAVFYYLRSHQGKGKLKQLEMPSSAG